MVVQPGRRLERKTTEINSTTTQLKFLVKSLRDRRLEANTETKLAPAMPGVKQHRESAQPWSALPYYREAVPTTRAVPIRHFDWFVTCAPAAVRTTELGY